MKKIAEKKMVKHALCAFLLTFAVSSSIFASPPPPPPPPPPPTTEVIYAQLSSLDTQLPKLENVTLHFEVVDGLSGLTLDHTHRFVKVKKAGIYFIQAKGQVGAQGLGLYGSTNIWLNANGEKIFHSQSSQTVLDNQSSYSIVSQTVISLKTGDLISVGASADSTSLGLIAQANENFPSVTLSIYKLN